MSDGKVSDDDDNNHSHHHRDFPAIAVEEDSSETTLSLPAHLNSQQLSSETTTDTIDDTTLTPHNTNTSSSGGAASSSTGGGSSSYHHEIQFLPKPNPNRKPNRPQQQRRRTGGKGAAGGSPPGTASNANRPSPVVANGDSNNPLFLLTTDSSSSKSEDDDIHVEEEDSSSFMLGLVGRGRHHHSRTENDDDEVDEEEEETTEEIDVGTEYSDQHHEDSEETLVLEEEQRHHPVHPSILEAIPEQQQHSNARQIPTASSSQPQDQSSSSLAYREIQFQLKPHEQEEEIIGEFEDSECLESESGLEGDHHISADDDDVPKKDASGVHPKEEPRNRLPPIVPEILSPSVSHSMWFETTDHSEPWDDDPRPLQRQNNDSGQAPEKGPSSSVPASHSHRSARSSGSQSHSHSLRTTSSTRRREGVPILETATSSAPAVASSHDTTPVAPPRGSPKQSGLPAPHLSPTFSPRLLSSPISQIRPSPRMTSLQPREQRPHLPKQLQSPQHRTYPGTSATTNNPLPSPSFKELMSAASQIATPPHSPILLSPSSSNHLVDQAPENNLEKNESSSSLTSWIDPTSVARRPNDDHYTTAGTGTGSLYEELLRYHREHDNDSETDRQVVAENSHSNTHTWRNRNALMRNQRQYASNASMVTSTTSILSHEDSKPPAAPYGSTSLGGMPAQYQSSPYYQELMGAREQSSQWPRHGEPNEKAQQPSSWETTVQQQQQPRRPPNNVEQDEAIARILQEELEAEQRRNEEESLRAALALQQQEEQAAAAAARGRSDAPNSSSNVPLPVDTSVEEQLRILQQIQQQQEETQLRQALSLSSHSTSRYGTSDFELHSSSHHPSSGTQSQHLYGLYDSNAPGHPSSSMSYRPQPPQPSRYQHTAHSPYSSYQSQDRPSSHFSSGRSHLSASSSSPPQPRCQGHSAASIAGAPSIPNESALADAFERQFRLRDTRSDHPTSSSPGQHHAPIPQQLQPRRVYTVPLQSQTQQPQLSSSITSASSPMTSSFQHRPMAPPPSASFSSGISSSVGSATGGGRPDWELSQHQALLEYQRQPSPPPPMPQATGIHAATSSPSDLVRRGAVETERAVLERRAHIVICQGCQARLQAPIHYALVYCPSCGVVSPGRSYVPSTSISSPSQEPQHPLGSSRPTGGSPGARRDSGGRLDQDDSESSWNYSMN